MIKCPRCNSFLFEDAKYCFQCGLELNDARTNAELKNIKYNIDYNQYYYNQNKSFSGTLILAILSIFLFLPTGIIALYFYIKANNLINDDYYSAKRYSNRSLFFGILSIFLFIVSIIIIIVMGIHYLLNTQGTEHLIYTLYT